jgi:hypothetical protein
MKDVVFELAKEFSAETHGSSDYAKDETFVMGANLSCYVPFSFLQKKTDTIKSIDQLQKEGFIFSSADYLDNEEFNIWFRGQFNRKLTQTALKSIGILHYPDEVKIIRTIEDVNKAYEILKDKFVILNGKNLPVQLGEWFAKCIFGLHQKKSSSQRGFDFFDGEGNRIEVMVHWSDRSSPKGVKLKKSLVELSDFCIIIYMATNFMIREILFLDSSFIFRKFGGKGHTVFLKDINVSSYFFSVSNKHFDRVVNKNSLMKFASPTFAMKLDGRFE